MLLQNAPPPETCRRYVIGWAAHLAIGITSDHGVMESAVGQPAVSKLGPNTTGLEYVPLKLSATELSRLVRAYDDWQRES